MTVTAGKLPTPRMKPNCQQHYSLASLKLQETKVHGSTGMRLCYVNCELIATWGTLRRGRYCDTSRAMRVAWMSINASVNPCGPCPCPPKLSVGGRESVFKVWIWTPDPDNFQNLTVTSLSKGVCITKFSWIFIFMKIFISFTKDSQPNMFKKLFQISGSGSRSRWCPKFN